MNNRQFMKALNEIDDRYILEATDTEHIKELFKDFEEDGEQRNTKAENHSSGENISKRKRRNLRTLLIAAIIVIMILLAVSAGAQKFDSFWMYNKFGKQMLNSLDIGETTEYYGFTVEKGPEATKYENVESYINEAKLDILIPMKLPDAVEIDKVIVAEDTLDAEHNYEDKFIEVYFVTTVSNEYQITANTNSNIYDVYFTNERAIIETINGKECCTLSCDNAFECFYIYEGISYFVKAPTYDDVVTIVSNMKKYEKED